NNRMTDRNSSTITMTSGVRSQVSPGGPSTRRSSSRTPPAPPSPCPSRRRAIDRPSGESSRIAVIGIIKAMTSTMTKIHMDRILRGARPARPLARQCVEQTGAVADQERGEREHALLRLSLGVHDGPRARDQAHQGPALESLQAGDELFLDRLCTREGGVPGGLHGALQRRIDFR